MKRSLIPTALIAAAMLLCASWSLAAENKSTPAETKAVNGTKTTEKSAKAKQAKPAAKVKIVDINTAGKKELMTLPGIHDAEADKIIAGRPYYSKAELTTSGVLPRAVYEGLKSQVIAKQTKEMKAKLAK
jgi:DNA uptake protein ComE-like DNA-binding protein